MLQIAKNIETFRKGESKCKDCVQKAEYLALCTYVYAPHTIAICSDCIQTLEKICECGSGANASSQILSILDINGVEDVFEKFQDEMLPQLKKYKFRTVLVKNGDIIYKKVIGYSRS